MQIRRKVEDTLDVNKKIDYKDDLELVTLRWKYFLKSPNPTTERLEDFRPLIEKISKETYNKFSSVFGIVGYDLDDIINIARCHAVNYMGIFSIEENEEQLAKFVRVYKNRHGEDSYPKEQDIRNKNMYNFSKFLVQRLEEVGKVVFQKNRSIRGSGEIFKIFESKDPLPCNDELLAEDHSRFNYKEMTKKKYEELKKSLGIKDDEGFYHNNTRIRVVKISAKEITGEEYYDSFVSRENRYYRDPEDMMLDAEGEIRMSKLSERFNNMTECSKISLLENFLEHRADSKGFETEIAYAKKVLKSLGSKNNVL
jgi:hypothetical protein